MYYSHQVHGIITEEADDQHFAAGDTVKDAGRKPDQDTLIDVEVCLSSIMHLCLLHTRYCL